MPEKRPLKKQLHTTFVFDPDTSFSFMSKAWWSRRLLSNLIIPSQRMYYFKPQWQQMFSLQNKRQRSCPHQHAPHFWSSLFPPPTVLWQAAISSILRCNHAPPCTALEVAARQSSFLTTLEAIEAEEEHLGFGVGGLGFLVQPWKWCYWP